MRGELGGRAAILIRGVAGLNVTSGGYGGIFQPIGSGRLELALSWSLQ